LRRFAFLILVISAPAVASAQTIPRWDPALVLARTVALGPPRVRAFFPSARPDGIGVVLRFAAPPTDRDLERVEQAGARLARFDRSGRGITAGPMVGAFMK